MYTIKLPEYNLKLEEFELIAKQKGWQYSEDEDIWDYDTIKIVFSNIDHLINFVMYCKLYVPQN